MLTYVFMLTYVSCLCLIVLGVHFTLVPCNATNTLLIHLAVKAICLNLLEHIRMHYIYIYTHEYLHPPIPHAVLHPMSNHASLKSSAVLQWVSLSVMHTAVCT